tara:strand:- start:1 stop:237 length:237 start_codon:yes stop_codon:yes gene_type:complete
MEESYTREKLSKQSIRGNVSINMNGTVIDDKDILIKESQTWTDKDIIFFKKMLKQGGKFSIGGRKFFVIPNEDNRSLN